jgi:catechol 2,3-dioxygenase-like lactoylglutathione lyase family enzyme
MKSIGIHEYGAWPPLPLEQWRDTYATLHMWSQIVGKIRMALTPLVNHWWNVPLYVNTRGLTTSAIPYGDRSFELWFDFLDHQLVLHASDGSRKVLPLIPMSVADFYQEVLGMLRSSGIEVKIWRMPVEVPDPIPFDEDRVHASYDPDAAQRFWKILLGVQGVFDEFRSRFLGKCSPIHFFWGSFDLAVTRFSGRRAPERPNADRITREAYSHEVSSVGFWPGSGNIAGPAFYSYTAPEPPGFRDWRVRPAAARYDAQLGEFILMYDDMRTSATPGATLLDFCQSTYEAGATLGKWDRDALERQPGTTLDKSA